MSPTKITAKFFAPMYADFDRQMSAALLRRDAFLDRMIAEEIPHLREDLSGKRLSSEARKYISQSLKWMGDKGTPPLIQLSIVVSHETSKALNEVVEEHNLVRDSFLNLLIALLRSSDTLLDRLGLPARISNSRRDGTDNLPTSPMRAIEEIQCDPLYYLRNACEKEFGCGLYMLPLPQEMHGFSCFLPDDDVPGTQSNKEKQEKEKDLLISLDIFESSIPAIKNIKKTKRS